MPMADVIVRIPHCIWRNGRPRFVPGPGLRKLGFEGRDLRHGTGGPWYSLDETKAESDRIIAEVAERRGKKAGGAKRLPPVQRPPGYFTLDELFAEVEASPRGGSIRRTSKPLSERTKTFYRQNTAVLREMEPALFPLSVRAFTPADMFSLSERILAQRGVSVMRAVMATISRAFSYAKVKGRLGPNQPNPCLQLAIPKPNPRVRAGSVLEIASLIAAADIIGRADVGDMIAFAVAGGNRQGDRWRFIMVRQGDHDPSRLRVQQSKRGAIVSIRQPGFLAKRLAAAADRRAAAQRERAEQGAARKRPIRLIAPELLLNEDLWRPWKKKAWADAYAEVKAAAVAGIKGESPGTWLLPPCPSVEDLRDQDMRDTHITWLANSGGNLNNMRATTGLSLQSITQNLVHYMAIDPEQADQAIALLEAWLQPRAGDSALSAGKPGEG